jgi:uncharacterized protein YjiS (DUF1127 family)
MASTTTNSSGRPGFLGAVFARLMQGLENHMRVASRRDLVERLEAKSDAELAELGIRREDITKHIFRDLFYA